MRETKKRQQPKTKLNTCSDPKTGAADVRVGGFVGADFRAAAATGKGKGWQNAGNRTQDDDDEDRTMLMR